MATAAESDPQDTGLGRHGWTLVWSLAAAQLVSWGSLYYSFSLFVLPMEAELGWSRPEINGALSVGLLVAGLAALPFGILIDRGLSRPVMLSGSLLAGLLLLMWSWTDNLFVFYAIWTLMGLSLAGTLYEPAFAVLAGRLGHGYRRGITAVTLVGGFASTVFIPLTQIFIEWLGWRDALIALAGFNLLFTAVIHAFVLAPAFGREPSDGGAVPVSLNKGILRKVARHPAFWLLLVAFAAYNAAFAGLTFHLVPMLVERGLSIATVVAALALIGPMQVAGRVGLMLAGDRLTASAAGRFCLALLAVSVLMLVVLPNTVLTVFAFAAVYGTANGLATIVRATIVPEILSREGYATINGAVAMASMIAKAIAPFLAALLWEASGGYDAVLIAAFACTVAATGAFWLAGTAGRRP